MTRLDLLLPIELETRRREALARIREAQRERARAQALAEPIPKTGCKSPALARAASEEVRCRERDVALVDGMYERLLTLRAAEGRPVAAGARAVGYEARRRAVARAVHYDPPAGWWFVSLFEEDLVMVGWAGRPRVHWEPGEPAPCDVPPGSPAKVRILAGRAAAGEELWHPDDPTALPEIADLASASHGAAGVPVLGGYRRDDGAEHLAEGMEARE